jgi:putative ABC transport system permease protein
VRKVLGASVSSIVTLLSADFIKLICVALLIASPVSYWAMDRWLRVFAYRVNISWWIFALAGSAAVGVAFVTIGFQTVRAALANPVDSLKDL